MRISGLTAPIPAGAVFGYQPGGWGMPPVDEYGRPLYGDVFGVGKEEDTEVVVDRTTRWGELEDVEEEEEEGEEEEEEEYDADGTETPMTLDGVSTIAGTETPDTIVDLRKRAGLETPDSFTSSRELYQVLQEKQVQGVTGQMFGSDRTYVLPGKGDVQISMNPDELEEHLKDKDKIRDEYDAATALEGTEYEDKEDGVLKKKRRVDTNSVAAKRYKDFKF
jgi:splicing factor 3B subunit 2